MKALVMSCGDCSDASKRKTIWLEKLSEEAKKELEAGTVAQGAPMPDRYIAVPPSEAGGEIRWVHVRTPAAAPINKRMRDFRARCPGKDATICFGEQNQSDL